MIELPTAMSSINDIIALSRAAGEILMHYYRKANISMQYKLDNSPVTVADLESNELICRELIKLYPDIPVIAEESDNPKISKGKFWLVDPLDATKSYLSGQGEFTVNIGLIDDGKPVLGVIYAPLHDQLYYAVDGVAYKQSTGKINTRKVPEEGMIVLTSVFSTNYAKLDEYLLNKKVSKIVQSSSALKICMIAEGLADLYPRFGPTMEWDTAAGHAILNAAGGSIKNIQGDDLSYGHPDKAYLNPDFIASGFII